MYIKQIVIQGFKSYKEQTIIEPFSPKHNVIVGRNGSGKSNFFAAIRFVLSDAYTQMHREERQALLHEGTGSSVMSAYVEITFDNSDERFPTGKPELILRRTIGLKKDEYSLDRKSATKADVMNLLESAGFSRSNPYYIVPQGRVTTLTNMKDGERLNLLKEVAGTHVYETRRAESLKIMDDTANKRAKVDESLSYIQDRLMELEEEKEELRQYQDKEREKRCLEYTMYHREQIEYANALENLDQQRQSGIEETDDNRERFLEGEGALSDIDQQIKDFQQQIEFLKVDKKQFEDERRDSARHKAQIELEVRSTIDGQHAAQATRSQYESDLQEVEAAIEQRVAQLAQILPGYTNRKNEESIARARLSEAESQRQRLYAKQGRSSQFKTRKDRDAWLKKEIDEVNIALATRKAVAMQTAEEIVNINSDVAKLDAQVAVIRSKLDNRDNDMSSLVAEVQKAKEIRDSLQDQRKELWRQEAKLDTVISNARKEQDQAQRALSHMMDHSTSRGLAAVRRIKAQLRLDGVYGTLAELFEVSDKYKTAVEVTAGNSLFHYVVDTDETASKIMEILQKENAGRVTFMPLNRLRPKPVNIPKSNDVVEMVSRLKFDSKYEKAFQQVFGRTVICPNLQIAAQTARSHGVSAITPDGDRSDKKGALSGGYHDPRQSRLDAVRTLTKWRQGYEEQRKKDEEIKRDLERKDQEITHAVSNLQKAEQKKQQLENSYAPLQQELRNITSELEKKKESLEVKQRAADNVTLATNELGVQHESYEAELAVDFKKALSDIEEQQLEKMNTLIPELRKNVMEISQVRAELETRKSNFEVELRENLRPRLDQLKSQEHDDGTASTNSRLKERQKELKIATKTVDAAEKRLRETEGAMDELVTKLNDVEESRSTKQREQEEIARAIERQQKKLDKSAHARSRLNDQMTDCTRNIRDLGVLPEEAFTKYAKISYEKAQKRLQVVKEALKKYGHVNKKAFEQYSNFTRHRDGLIKRRSDLSKADTSIRGLIENLDQRKDEAIERTFKQVSREFASIFEKLVPAGRGRLIIQRKTDRNAQDVVDGEDSDVERRDGVENYTGVGISVSFNSKHDEQQRIQQLSGGQKSLCALALVFAIQQCDPAPFYLFDEIDANLDAQYRTAVAALLEQISKGGQFICTTFRPEMVHVAEKCYGVSYQNKTSSIDVVGREAALEFVEGQVGGM